MVDLYWIPLGAGGNFVRLNGQIYEAISAFMDRRPRRRLYHSALVVSVPEGRYVVEMGPVTEASGHSRAVVAEGPVGTAWAGRWRIFRYELRCWADGSIPDIYEAVNSPVRVSGDVEFGRRVISLVPKTPRLTWGRDEAKAGEMWNSNSMTSWLLTEAGFDASSLRPPAGGRAPGWDAGIAVARGRTSKGVPTPSWFGG